MKGDLRFNVDVSDGCEFREWNLDTLVPVSPDRFAVLDEDGNPRLLLTRDELASLQHGEDAQVGL